jgi:purine-nucleoside phosphorylase
LKEVRRSGIGVLPEKLKGSAGTAVVIGSGLSPGKWPGKILAEAGYAEIDGMTVPAVEGHPGRLLLLDTGRGRLLLFAGRSHLYEGAGWDGAGCCAVVAAALGCRRIIFTQAAGSLKRSLPVESWLLPSGIVALPWSGSRLSSSARPVISRRLRGSVASAAADSGVELADGVLCWTAGPVYETLAEAEAAALMGADAVTMSPLPELAAAAGMKLEAACLSFITNFAPNVMIDAAGHMEVLKIGKRGAEVLSRMLPQLAKI